MYGVVYKITNKINGRVYIGQTTKTVEARFKQHCLADTVIGSAIRKYHPGNFDKELLAVSFDAEALDTAEQALIQAFHSRVPNGYNVKVEGTYVSPCTEASDDGEAPTWSNLKPHEETFYTAELNFKKRVAWLVGGTEIDVQAMAQEMFRKFRTQDIGHIKKFLKNNAKAFHIQLPVLMRKTTASSVEQIKRNVEFICAVGDLTPYVKT